MHHEGTLVMLDYVSLTGTLSPPYPLLHLTAQPPQYPHSSSQRLLPSSTSQRPLTSTTILAPLCPQHSLVYVLEGLDVVVVVEGVVAKTLHFLKLEAL